MEQAETKTKILIGANTLEKLPEMIHAYGSHPLLVHGHRPVEDGLLEKVRVLLTEAGIPHTDMGQILPNPKYDSVLRGVETAKKHGCDLILSLGGGSTLQCAKGIAYGMEYQSKKPLWSLWTGKNKPHGAMPVAAILTNPASGAELNDECTLVRNGKQKNLTSQYGYCKFAILDPTLSMLPAYPTMNQAFGILSFIFDRYLLAQEGLVQKDLDLLKKLMDCTSALSTNLYDVKARSELFEVGVEAHQIHQKSDPDLSSLINNFSYHYSLPRGTATSALFFAWIKNLMGQYEEKIAELARFLFEIDAGDEHKTAILGIHALENHVQKMGLAVDIPQTGLVMTKKELKKLAKDKNQLKILEEANKGSITQDLKPVDDDAKTDKKHDHHKKDDKDEKAEKKDHHKKDHAKPAEAAATVKEETTAPEKSASSADSEKKPEAGEVQKPQTAKQN